MSRRSDREELELALEQMDDTIDLVELARKEKIEKLRNELVAEKQRSSEFRKLLYLQQFVLEEQRKKREAAERKLATERRNIVHCENCGDSWFDSGLHAPTCPYCALEAERKKRIGGASWKY